MLAPLQGSALMLRLQNNPEDESDTTQVSVSAPQQIALNEGLACTAAQEDALRRHLNWSFCG